MKNVEIEIRLVKGPAGKRKDQRRVLEALGLRRWGQSVRLVDAPSIRGMLIKVSHLITVHGPGGDAR